MNTINYCQFQERTHKWFSGVMLCILFHCSMNWNWIYIPSDVQRFMEPKGSLPLTQEPATHPSSEPNPVHTPHSMSLRSISTLSFHLFLGLPNYMFPSGLPTKRLCAFHFSPTSATCLTNLILIDLIVLIHFGEGYKWWSSSLSSCLQLCMTSSILVLHIFLSVLFSNTLSLLFFLLMWETKFYTHTKQYAKL
jgi:hypothetical protein